MIESLFVPLDLSDQVQVALTSGAERNLSLECMTEGVPGGGENLAMRAAEAFLDRAGLEAGLRIRLRKRIPPAAGLGGGSSDAASVLRALQRLLPAALGERQIADLAVSLGADLPFFLTAKPAFVSGIGERIELAHGIPGLPLLLTNPGSPLSTAEVYGLYDQLQGALTPTGAGPTMRSLSAPQGASASESQVLQAFLRVLRNSHPRDHQGRGSEGGSPLLENDLEPAAVRLCPAVETLRREMKRVGAVETGLSGSGPTVFGIFASLDSAREAREQLALSPPARSWVATSTPST